MAIIDYKDKYEKAVQAAMLAKQDTESAVTIGILEEIFPELRESEDERIRKEMITYFSTVEDKELIPYESWIAYLEKQGNANKEYWRGYREGKQEILDKYTELEKQGEPNTVVVIPKFRVGDVIRSKGSMAEYTIESISGECYHGKGWGLHISCDDDYELVKQNNAWSEEDIVAIDCAVEVLSKDLPSLAASIERLKSLRDSVQPKQEWKQENTGDLTDFENAMMHIGDSFFGQHQGLDPNDTSVVKEQAKLLLELVPKQEWSEEEIENCAREAEDNSCIILAKHIRQLKSLRPQNTWKPSDEQISVLEFIMEDIEKDSIRYRVLNSVLEQLKKLRKE